MSKKLGRLIKDARTEKGLSQAALAQEAGISASEIGKIERGEKEPAQDVLKKLAKPLGMTQKALLEAAAGAGAGSANASAAKTSSKTSSKKGSSSAGTAASVTTLTAAEKKLVQLYRRADSNTKKAAVSLLSGDGNIVEILAPVLLAKKAGKTEDDKDLASMASGIFDTLLSGKK